MRVSILALALIALSFAPPDRRASSFSGLRSIPSDATFSTIEGRRVRVDELPGSYELLVFWNTRDAASNRLVGRAAELHSWATKSAPNVRVFLIHAGGEARQLHALQALIEGTPHSLALPNLVDLGGRMLRSLGGGTPQTMLIEHGGRIVEAHRGERKNLVEMYQQRFAELGLVRSAPE